MTSKILKEFRANMTSKILKKFKVGDIVKCQTSDINIFYVYELEELGLTAGKFYKVTQVCSKTLYVSNLDGSPMIRSGTTLDKVSANKKRFTIIADISKIPISDQIKVCELLSI